MPQRRKSKVPSKARRTTSTPRRGPTRSLNATVKRIALKQCETKQSNQYTASLQTLGHDRTYYTGQLLATTQGIAEPDGIEEATGNRIGNKVVARGLKMRVYLENEASRPNVMYKIFIFKYNTLLVAGGATLQDPEFWCGTDGTGTITNRLLDSPQTRHIRILRSKTIKPVNQANYSIQTAGPVPVGPFSKTDYHEFYIPMKNKMIQYRDNDSVFPVRDGYGMAILAFDTQNTALSTHIGNVMWRSQFFYKDP